MRAEPVANPDYLDFKATITVCVVAVVLTFREFQGYDLSVLHLDHATWPREPWRLLTSCFLHGSWLHLLFNVWMTFRVGAILEPALGLGATIGLYVFLGLTSQAAQFAFSGPAVGLSGIVFGAFSLLWVLGRYHPSFRGVMSDDMAWWLVGWFFLCILLTEFRIMAIANVAHGAGAVFGALVGWTLTPLGLSRGRAWSLLVGLTLLVGAVSTVGLPYARFGRDRVPVLWYRSVDALQAGEDRRAAELIEDLLELDDEIPEAWHNLGIAYERLGAEELSDAAFQRAAELQATAGG